MFINKKNHIVNILIFSKEQEICTVFDELFVWIFLLVIVVFIGTTSDGK